MMPMGWFIFGLKSTGTTARQFAGAGVPVAGGEPITLESVERRICEVAPAVIPTCDEVAYKRALALNTITVVEGFRLTEIAAWAQQHLSADTQVRSDGLACFNGVTAAGCVHEPVVAGGGKAALERPEFHWVKPILGNIKSALLGTYHAIRPKYAQRYLAEFEYRFNRRFHLPEIIPRLVYVALRTPPMPERLLKLRLA